MTDEASSYLDPGKPTYVGPWLDMVGKGHAEHGESVRPELRRAEPIPKALPSLSECMWSDIACILGAAYPKDCA